MSVYVDGAENVYGIMKMCHMLADTLPELMAMADRIGVNRRWYQGFDKASCPHFDICKSMRVKAIKAGAIEVSMHELAVIMRTIKGEARELVKQGHKHGWEV